MKTLSKLVLSALLGVSCHDQNKNPNQFTFLESGQDGRIVSVRVRREQVSDSDLFYVNTYSRLNGKIVDRGIPSTLSFPDDERSYQSNLSFENYLAAFFLP